MGAPDIATKLSRDQGSTRRAAPSNTELVAKELAVIALIGLPVALAALHLLMSVPGRGGAVTGPIPRAALASAVPASHIDLVPPQSVAVPVPLADIATLAPVEPNPAVGANAVAGQPEVTASTIEPAAAVDARTRAGHWFLNPSSQAAPAGSNDAIDAGASADVAGQVDFGLRLATAAERQLQDLVIYSDRYQTMAYPMGDVPAMYGVCSDVIVRAYRELGIDLQALVHAARVGRGDPNIDHRRTVVLRRFFQKYGLSIAVTDIAEDYQPGDIVTYDRPQNGSGRYHIAIVSRHKAPSGRPMILHNRGWGPQLEDALFVNRITGHFRYDGQKMPSREALKNAPAARYADRQPVTKQGAALEDKRRRVLLKPKRLRRAEYFGGQD